MHDAAFIPKVAVLLAAYNGISWINEQVDSILKQTDVDVELFISIDQSNDGTYEWCKKLEALNNNINVLPYGERFGGAASNFYRLIRDTNISNFNFVALSDQDDIWLSKKLSHAIDLIKEQNLDALSSDVIAFWNDEREYLVKKSYPQKLYDHFFESAGPGCTYVFTVSSFERFKIFLENDWKQVVKVDLHDWMIYAFYRENNMKWLIDDIPLLKYRQHTMNQVGVNSGIQAYKKRLKLVKEKWYRREVEKISHLLGRKSPSRLFCLKNFLQLRRRPRDAFTLLMMNLVGLF
jgi:rhamnosyltransferase